MAVPDIVRELAIRARDCGAMPRRIPRALWCAAQRICIAAVLMLGAMAAANAACDQTTNSTSGVTINFTSVGQTYRLCLTVGSGAADDSVVYGVYSVAGTDAFWNAPIANSSGTNAGNQQLTAADYNPTTAKATYTFHPTNPNQNGQSAKAGQAEIDITLNSKTGNGQELYTLYYAPGCSDFNLSCSGSSIANTPYVFTINLPCRLPPSLRSRRPRARVAAAPR